MGDTDNQVNQPAQPQPQPEPAQLVQVAVLVLPPGFLFHPSEEQLLSYYLTNRNNITDNSIFCGCNVIPEIDLPSYEPYDLPEEACFAYGCGGSKNHCYFYTDRVLAESGNGGRAVVKGGFWKRTSVKNVISPGGTVVLGTKTGFVFHFGGDSPRNSVKTDWVMHEYALANQAQASLVLCRVFVKSRAIGIQTDGYLASGIEPVENPSGIPQVRTSGVTDGDMSDEDEARQALLSIIEGNFLELDDLLD